MDFAQFEMVDKPVFLQFDHPATLQPLFEPRLDAEGNVLVEKDEETGEEKPVLDPVGVMLFGVDSDVYKKRRREVLDERIATAQATKKTTIKAAEAEEEGMRTLVACIHSFVKVEFKGEPLTDRKRYALFLKEHGWAKDQIDRGIADRSRFMKASSSV